MQDSEGSRLARLEERVEGVRHDVASVMHEVERARARLHNLEGFAQAYLDTQKANRRAESRQYRRLEIRVQVLTLAVGLAAIASPVIVAILTGK